MTSPIERRYTTIATLYWFDLDRSELIETATDETLREAGYVPASDLAAAVAHVRELSEQLERATKRATEAERSRDFAVKGHRAVVEKLTRYAALEKAARAWAESTSGVTGLALRRAIGSLDAVAPAAVGESDKPGIIMRGPKCDQCTGTPENCAFLDGGASPEMFDACEDFEPKSAAKPATCGECDGHSGRWVCMTAESSHCGEHRAASDPACPAFTRRMPVVASIPCAVSGEEPAQ